MTIEATSAVAGAAAAQSGGTSGAKAALTSDFETFIQMLTTQARYQDPLEPLDSTEYAAQLAQFSMVEQQVQSNELLESVYQQINLSNMAALSGWVGMEARAATEAGFDGATPVQVVMEADPIAYSADLEVRDGNGDLVQRIPVPAEGTSYEWSGINDEGGSFAAGNYTFHTVSYDQNGDRIGSNQAEVYTLVQETQMTPGGVVLIGTGGQEISSASVTALRDPSI